MLEGNEVAQRRFGKTGSELCQLTRHDGRAHDAVQILPTNHGPVVLIWHTCTSTRTVSRQTDVMRHHVAAKKYQLHAAQAARFLYNGQTGDLETFIYNNTPHEPDPQLDEAIKKLRPIEDARRTPNALAAIRRIADRRR